MLKIWMVNITRAGPNITRNTLLLENTWMTLGQSMVHYINQQIMPTVTHRPMGTLKKMVTTMVNCGKAHTVMIEKFPTTNED